MRKNANLWRKYMSLRILGLFVYITLLEAFGIYFAIFLLLQDGVLLYGL